MPAPKLSRAKVSLSFSSRPERVTLSSQVRSADRRARALLNCAFAGLLESAAHVAAVATRQRHANENRVERSLGLESPPRLAFTAFPFLVSVHPPCRAANSSRMKRLVNYARLGRHRHICGFVGNTCSAHREW